MKPPISYRKDIPFFHEKTAAEFQKDIYERYDDFVVKQSSLHLADEVWDGYPWQPVLDFAAPHFSGFQPQKIVELGCGVGRWIGQIAQNFPEANCWGIDYSYQMLKRAREFWVEGKMILFDLTKRGYAKRFQVQGHQLGNLQFGLAKASNLPFDENSQDLVLNSFLLDRLENPIKGLKEMYRILKPDGKLILLSPLNFGNVVHWQNYYPPVKLYHILLKIGFEIEDWQENIEVREPLDLHGNVVCWKCLGFVVRKK